MDAQNYSEMTNYLNNAVLRATSVACDGAGVEVSLGNLKKIK